MSVNKVLKGVNKWGASNPISILIITSIFSSFFVFFSDLELSKIVNIIRNMQDSQLQLIIKICISILLVTFMFALMFIFFTPKNKYKNVGIIKVDKSIDSGITPEEMLKKVKNNFRFLGTGANKLTSKEELFKNILNCGGAKFLICNPESEALKIIGNRSNEDYAAKVKVSVNKIKAYINQGHDIKLRLYDVDEINKMPIFRLAFYNDTCLCSYNYFSPDNNDGRQLPQLHIQKYSGNNPHESYYYAFNAYFDSLWELNEANEYVKNNGLGE